MSHDEGTGYPRNLQCARGRIEVEGVRLMAAPTLPPEEVELCIRHGSRELVLSGLKEGERIQVTRRVREAGIIRTKLRHILVTKAGFIVI